MMLLELKPMPSPLITTSWPSVPKPSLMLKKDSSKTELLSLHASKILLIPKLSELKEKLTSPLLKKILLTNLPDGPEKFLSSKP